MGFVIGWLWYLLAFAAGSLVAWVAAVLLVPARAGADPTPPAPGAGERR